MINADWVQLNCRCKPQIVSWCKLEYVSTGRGYVEGKGVVETFAVKKDFEGIAYDTIFSETVYGKTVLFHPDYKVVKQDIRTPLCDTVLFVYYKDTRIAEVVCDVNSKVIDENTVFVRFDNKFLYGENLFDRVCKFLEENNLVFHNWTRFDVCCDFNYFNNGLSKRPKVKELNPSVFIKKYVTGEVRLLNKRRGKKRKGNLVAKDNEYIPVDETEFKRVAEKNKAEIRDMILKNENIPNREKKILLNEMIDKQTLSAWFEDGTNGIDLQTLKLGSSNSAVKAKLYNKSQELRDMEDKPYIREQWTLNGLDIHSIETRERLDTWRVEFSMNDFNSIVCDDADMQMKLKTLDILKDENCELLWNVLQEHYFNFYKPSKTDTNVTRGRQRIRLFDKEETGLKLREDSGKKNTTRAHKIFIKKLLETQQTIREHHAEMKQVNWATDYVAAWLVNKHDLFEWSKARFPSWKVENYVDVPDVRVDVTQLSLIPNSGYKINGAIYPDLKREPHNFSY